MRSEEFEQLVERAGLNLLSKYAPRFVVSLRIPHEYHLERGGVVLSEHIQCETLAYEPAEFTLLTPERAKQQIEACKKGLEKEAKKKMGASK